MKNDLISRQAATQRILERTPFKSKHELMQRINSSIADENGWLGGIAESLDEIEDLPAVVAVPVVRCKDCKYRDENWRRVSTRWLPCMDMRPGSNWYCGSAERGEQNG